MRILFLVIMIVTNFLFSFAQGKESCDKAMDLIPKHGPSKKIFSEIFKFKQKFSHCMDGAIAEGIAGVVVDSLDKNWSQLSDVDKLSKKDTSFKKFILNNIEPNVTAQEKEVNNIINHAKKSCPKEMKVFCEDLIKTCEQSLKPEQ